MSSLPHYIFSIPFSIVCIGDPDLSCRFLRNPVGLISLLVDLPEWCTALFYWILHRYATHEGCPNKDTISAAWTQCKEKWVFTGKKNKNKTTFILRLHQRRWSRHKRLISLSTMNQHSPSARTIYKTLQSSRYSIHAVELMEKINVRHFTIPPTI